MKFSLAIFLGACVTYGVAVVSEPSPPPPPTDCAATCMDAADCAEKPECNDGTGGLCNAHCAQYSSSSSSSSGFDDLDTTGIEDLTESVLILVTTPTEACEAGSSTQNSLRAALSDESVGVSDATIDLMISCVCGKLFAADTWWSSEEFQTILQVLLMAFDPSEAASALGLVADTAEDVVEMTTDTVDTVTSTTTDLVDQGTEFFLDYVYGGRRLTALGSCVSTFQTPQLDGSYSLGDSLSGCVSEAVAQIVDKVLSTTEGICQTDCTGMVTGLINELAATQASGIGQEILQQIAPSLVIDDVIVSTLAESGGAILGCLCSGLFATASSAALVSPIATLVVEVVGGISGGTSTTTLNDVFDLVQSVYTEVMSATLLCSAGCRQAAGALLEIGTKFGFAFFDTNVPGLVSSLLTSDSYTLDHTKVADLPSLPATLAADLSSAMDCLCAPTLSLAGFVDPIKAIVNSFLPTDQLLAPMLSGGEITNNFDPVSAWDLYTVIGTVVSDLLPHAFSSTGGLCSSSCVGSMKTLMGLGAEVGAKVKFAVGGVGLPAAIKTAVVTATDEMADCLCSGETDFAAIWATASSLGPASTGAKSKLQLWLDGLIDSGTSIGQIDFETPLKALVPAVLSSKGLCGSSCIAVGDTLFTLVSDLETFVNSALTSEKDVALLEEIMMQVEGTTVGPFFTSLKGRTAGAALSLPTNLKTVITAWGGCMCSGSIDWDKAISLGFGWGGSAIFPSIDGIWDSGNSLTTLGDGASYYYTGWYPQEGADILATAIYPMIKDTVLMVLGPGGLCSGACVGAVSATLSAAADPGVLQSVLDNLAQVSFDGGGVSFGDGSDGLISGGLTVPPTLGASVGAVASCVCGGVASGAPLIDWSGLFTTIESYICPDSLRDPQDAYYTPTCEFTTATLGYLFEPDDAVTGTGYSQVVSLVDSIFGDDYFVCSGTCEGVWFNLLADLMSDDFKEITWSVASLFWAEDPPTVEGWAAALPTAAQVETMGASGCVCSAARDVTALVEGVAASPDWTSAVESLTADAVAAFSTCTLTAAEQASDAIEMVVELSGIAADEVDAWEEANLEAFKTNVAAAAGVSADQVVAAVEIVEAVTMSVKIDATIESFDLAAFKAKIVARVCGGGKCTADDVTVVLSGGSVVATSTIKTKDAAAAATVKEELTFSSEAEAEAALDVPVEEAPAAPTVEQKVEVTSTIVVDDKMQEADVVSGLGAVTASAEAASVALGVTVADVSQPTFVDSQSLSPPPPPSPAAPTPTSPPVCLCDGSTVSTECAEFCAAAVGLGVGILVVIIVIPIVVCCAIAICIVLCCVCKSKKKNVAPA